MPWVKQVTPQQSWLVPSALQEPALIHCTPIPWPARVVPALIAPAGVKEGGTTGAGGSRGDIQGSVTRETRGNKGEGVRMHTRGHRRAQRSRYRRMHGKGDVAVERAGNSS